MIRVLGPFHFVHLRLGERNFYLFGEEHAKPARRPKEGVPFAEFLEQVQPTLDEVVLEYAGEDRTHRTVPVLGPMRLTPASSYLVDTVKHFKKCFRRRCQPVFHYNDFRNRFWPYCPASQRSFLEIKMLLAPNHPEAEAFFQAYYPQDVSGWRHFLRQQFQLDRAEARCAPEVTEVVERWLQSKKWERKLNRRQILEVGLYFMDAFTILRCFRRTAGSHVLIYGGDVHILNYVRLLKDLGAQVAANEHGKLGWVDVELWRFFI